MSEGQFAARRKLRSGLAEESLMADKSSVAPDASTTRHLQHSPDQRIKSMPFAFPRNKKEINFGDLLIRPSCVVDQAAIEPRRHAHTSGRTEGMSARPSASSRRSGL